MFCALRGDEHVAFVKKKLGIIPTLEILTCHLGQRTYRAMHGFHSKPVLHIL
jgi:hypothetical protein